MSLINLDNSIRAKFRKKISNYQSLEPVSVGINRWVVFLITPNNNTTTGISKSWLPSNAGSQTERIYNPVSLLYTQSREHGWVEIFSFLVYQNRNPGIFYWETDKKVFYIFERYWQNLDIILQFEKIRMIIYYQKNNSRNIS